MSQAMSRIRRLHVTIASDLHLYCALGEIRTPNLLIRSQMLYPLSYERMCKHYSGENRSC